VIAGSYDLAYELTTAGSGAGAAITVPHNESAVLTCEAIK
jgi:hypothetical protein